MEVIDIIGLPGSGKSSLISAIVSKDPSRFCSTNQIYLESPPTLVRILFSLFPLTQRIKLSRLWFALITQCKFDATSDIRAFIKEKELSSDPAIHKQIYSQTLLGLKTFDYISEHLKTDKRILLFDEGISHRIISIFGEHDSPNLTEVDRYIGFCNVLNGIVYIETHLLKTVENSQRRGHPARLNSFSEQAVLDFFTKSKALLDKLFSESEIDMKIKLANDFNEPLTSLSDKLLSNLIEVSRAND